MCANTSQEMEMMRSVTVSVKHYQVVGEFTIRHRRHLRVIGAGYISEPHLAENLQRNYQSPYKQEDNT